MGNCGTASARRVPDDNTNREQKQQKRQKQQRTVPHGDADAGAAVSAVRNPPGNVVVALPTPRKRGGSVKGGGHPASYDVSSARQHTARAEKLLRGAALQEWERERWPWAWTLATPPGPFDTSQEEYRCYLSCFRVLSSLEAEAYQAYQEGDLSAARTLLATAPPPEDAPLLLLPPTHQQPQRRKRHTGVYGASSGDVADFTPPVVPKPPDVRLLLSQALRRCPLFSHLVRDAHFDTLVAAMQPVTMARGTVLFQWNRVASPGNAGLYVVASGRVLVSSPHVGEEQKGCGGFFGEGSAVNPNGRSVQTITSASPLACYRLPAEVFSGILGRQASEKRDLFSRYLRKIPYLAGIDVRQALQLADALQEKRYRQGEYIVEFGARGDRMHFIVEGEVAVVGREQKPSSGALDAGKHRFVCAFGAGHPVGYLEFFGEANTKNIADVVATSASDVVTACISREAFEALVGSVKDWLGELADAPEYDYYRSTKQERVS